MTSQKEGKTIWSAKQRLHYIEFKLFWEGRINRADIMEKFNISVPQASNDFGAYKDLAPNNLQYDHKQKSYFASESFEPVFLAPNAEEYLWSLRDDILATSGKNTTEGTKLPSHEIVKMPHRYVSPKFLRAIVMALQDKYTLEVCYMSMSNPEASWRIISPHAFGFDGSRWHIRAYCHTSSHFKDFLLSRILELRKTQESFFSGEQDAVWNEIVKVTLKPHPKLSKNQTEVVARDYGMIGNRLNISTRLAMLYYLLRRLGLQDGDGDSCLPHEQHVVIENKKEVQDAQARASYNP